MNYYDKEVISVKASQKTKIIHEKINIETVQMQNTGHALGISLKFVDNINNTLYWSENNQSYNMDSIHIHWGPPWQALFLFIEFHNKI